MKQTQPINPQPVTCRLIFAEDRCRVGTIPTALEQEHLIQLFQVDSRAFRNSQRTAPLTRRGPNFTKNQCMIELKPRCLEGYPNPGCGPGCVDLIVYNLNYEHY